MIGVILSVVAGAAMSFQGVINSGLGKQIGTYEANAFVQGTAFILGIIAMLILGKGDIKSVLAVNKIYWLGGVLGLIITITVMLGIGKLSPTQSIAIILISQLLVAALIDAFGLLGQEKVPFVWTKYLGLALMIIGVIVFKINKNA